MNAAQLVRASFAELIGAFALIFFGAGSILADAFVVYVQNLPLGPGLMAIPLAHGLTIAIMVCALGQISGGHFNPAVTVAMMLTNRTAIVNGAIYIVAQLLGAALAGFLLKAIFPYEALPVKLGTPQLEATVSVGQGFLIEAMLTCFLVLVIFGTAVDARGPRLIAGFCIGLTITLGILVGGPLTGGALNPARAFGPALATNFWEHHWIYWGGPIVGGTLAALVYQYLFLPREVARS